MTADEHREARAKETEQLKAVCSERLMQARAALHLAVSGATDTPQAGPLRNALSMVDDACKAVAAL